MPRTSYFRSIAGHNAKSVSVLEPPHTPSWQLATRQVSPDEAEMGTSLDVAKEPSFLAEERADPREDSRNTEPSDGVLSASTAINAEVPQESHERSAFSWSDAVLRLPAISTAEMSVEKEQSREVIQIHKLPARPDTDRDVKAAPQMPTLRAVPQNSMTSLAGEAGSGRYARSWEVLPDRADHSTPHRPVKVEVAAPSPVLEPSKHSPSRGPARQALLEPAETKQRTDAERTKTGRTQEIPEGNRIHIGTIDIQVMAPAVPVKSTPRRAAMAQTALARGFGSSLGLRQG